MNIDRNVVIKAGLIGGAAGLVIALLSRIAFLGCLIAPLGWVVAVGTGALYGYFATSEGAKVDIGGGAVGGAISGAIAGGVNGLVSGILTLAFGVVGAAATALGGEVGRAALRAGASFASVIGSVLLALIIGGALGALGGVIYVAIKGQKWPHTRKPQTEAGPRVGRGPVLSWLSNGSRF